MGIEASGAKPSTVHRKVPYNIDYPVQMSKCDIEAEVEKPWPTQRDLCPIFKVLLREYVLTHGLKALATRDV